MRGWVEKYVIVQEKGEQDGGMLLYKLERRGMCNVLEQKLMENEDRGHHESDWGIVTVERSHGRGAHACG